LPLEEDLSCPVCCEIFREPVLLVCGHSFCRECLRKHWSSSPGRSCPICRGSSPQEPLLNLSLRSTCESYLRERCSGSEEEERSTRCLLHGEKLELFCVKDMEAICSQCKKKLHRGHQVQSIHQAVKERKGKLKDAIKPYQDRLNALKNGTDPRAQAEKTERQIRKEFEKLFKFLRDEEKARLAAFKEEEESQSHVIKERIDGQTSQLTNTLKEMEDEIKQKDNIEFLQVWGELTLFIQLDPVVEAAHSLDVVRHLGNLRFRVWEKMKDVAPYSPVVLNPTAALCDLSVSEDLTSVSMRPEGSTGFSLVTGSEGFTDGFHSWDVEVGNSLSWMLGVTSKLGDGPVLCPQTGYWGIQRDNGCYQALASPVTPLHLSFTPQVVRVKLGWHWEGDSFGWCRRVTFSDATSGAEICKFSNISGTGALYPFLRPLQRSSQLKILPATVNVSVPLHPLLTPHIYTTMITDNSNNPNERTGRRC
uniref:Uncharacterized protein n=1 Tax=Denticeps clupeoides TaxID=299321 RepID=A0AAY4BLY8_9TELE